MKWLDVLKGDPLPWLMEPDPENPGVRFFAMRDLLGLPADDPKVIDARNDLMANGPVAAILEAQNPEGYWVDPGSGYNPKYRATLWQIIFLAQFGAAGDDDRVQAGCHYVLQNNPAPYGGLSASGTNSGLIHCLQGNLCAALIDLGYLADKRLVQAVDWLARSITGEGIAPSQERQAGIRYLRSGNSAPGFVCSANNHLPCAWGAVKAMLALSKVPEENQTPTIRSAIEEGIRFLLGYDPSIADYPMGYSTKPNRSWFKFGYPIGYVTDVLQNLEVLVALGLGEDPRLKPAIDLILKKQDDHGRWDLEYTYNGKTWVDVEEKGQPSKWVTLRALRVLKAVT